VGDLSGVVSWGLVRNRCLTSSKRYDQYIRIMHARALEVIVTICLMAVCFGCQQRPWVGELTMTLVSGFYLSRFMSILVQFISDLAMYLNIAHDDLPRVPFRCCCHSHSLTYRNTGVQTRRPRPRSR
jgi:hypothetical protein